MIQGYKILSIVYGGRGRQYAEALASQISEIAEKDRYPLKASIINERILTNELLSGVIKLFKDSEFCVVFLTEEDTCITEKGNKKRLRQNVVFELGMSLIEIGRERCILLSDFDVHSPNFDLPSDMQSLSVKQFNSDSFNDLMKIVIKKVLKMSRESINTGILTEEIPQYNYLLTRKEYRIAYENIFADKLTSFGSFGSSYLKSILSQWLEECKSLPYFDERCIYLLERLGFLPVFGRVPDVVDFMKEAENLIDNYHASEIDYYGDVSLLNFTRNLVQNVISYTLLKNEKTDKSFISKKYRALLNDYTSEPIPEDKQINPLLSVIYYDYLGLIYLHIYYSDQDKISLDMAFSCFNKSLEFASQVDRSLPIWEGFLSYNLARTYAENDNPKEAEKYYKKAISVRSRWLKSFNYNSSVRNALSYEYFIAKISYIDMCKKYDLMTDEEILVEYNYVENELDAYSGEDEQMNQLVKIRELLKYRIK